MNNSYYPGSLEVGLESQVAWSGEVVCVCVQAESFAPTTIKFGRKCNNKQGENRQRMNGIKIILDLW